MKKLIDSAILLAFITSILYLFSAFYYAGVMETLNLEPNKLERSFQLVIFSGFLLIFQYPIIVFGSIAITVFVLLLLLEFLTSNKFKMRRRLIKALNFKHKKKKKRNLIQRVTSFGMLYGLYPFIFCLIVFIFLGIFYKKGVSYAKTIYLLDSNTRMISTNIDGKKKSLKFLMCGVHNCSAIDTQTDEIHYIPANQHYSFLFSPPSKWKSEKTQIKTKK